jgi:hypothetical protein
MKLVFYLSAIVMLVGATSFHENRHLRVEKVSRHLQDDKQPENQAGAQPLNKTESRSVNNPPVPQKTMPTKIIDKKCKPPENCVDLTLSIFTDDYPEQTSVKAVELNSMTWIWWYETFEYPNEEYSLQQCVDPSGCYEVFIMDTEGNGIEGNEFELTYDNNFITWGERFTNYTVYEVGNGCASRPMCEMLELELTTDDYPRESKVNLYDSSTYTEDWSDTIIRRKNKLYYFSKCIDPLRCYTLNIFDSQGDGFEGNGGYTVYYEGEVWDTSDYAGFTDSISYYFGDC